MDQNALRIAGVDWSDAAQATLERAEKFDTGRGLDTIASMRARGAPLYCVSHQGAPVAWYVLELVGHPGGIEAVVCAAAGGARGVNLTAAISHAVELETAGIADHMTVHTMRPGLATKLTKLGWRADCLILRKALKCH